MIETKFKSTEIGQIPEDWKVQSLGDIASICGGGTPSTKIESYWGGKINWFTPAEIAQEAGFVYKSDRTITETGLNNSSAKILPKGSILLTTRATIGNRAIAGCEVCTNQGFQSLIPKRIDNIFLYYHISTIVQEMLSNASGSTFLEISGNKLSQIKISIPLEEEQSRIASALTSIDNLISSLDKLIAKKKNIKQGTMQQLLTGKKRLKGFSEPWVDKTLGSIGKTYSGLTGKTKEDFGTGNAKYITFLNVLNNPILNPKQFEQVVIKDGERQYNCCCGDLFFNTSSETPEEVGICAMLDTSINNLYLNSFCFGYRLADANVVPEYLAYYFRSDEGRKLMTGLAQGVTRYNMSKSAFNNAKILMPSNASEQKAITDVLICMDKEIESLASKKAKHEAIKQGMMQQLLTGKIRLI